MTDDDVIPNGRAVTRIDSFEEIECDCAVDLTPEERGWPVGTPFVRIDSFEEIGDGNPNDR